MNNDPMGETGFSGESAKIAFSEMEMAAAEQLMQLSEEETVSCSSSTTGGDFSGGRGGGENHKTRHEDVSSRIENDQNDGVRVNCNNLGVERKRKMKVMKEKKFRSLESIYRATKEIRN